jgi:hypothetical protein
LLCPYAPNSPAVTAENTRPQLNAAAGSVTAWTMGDFAVGDRPRVQAVHNHRDRLASFRPRGDLAIVCSRSGGSRRPPVCGKSPKVFAFAVPRWARGNVYSPSPASPWDVGATSLEPRFDGLRLRAAAPDSRPSFFSSSGLHPSFVART